MSLLPSDPFNQLTNNIFKEIERFFGELPLFKEMQLGSLHMDMKETDNEIVALCNIPGLDKNSDLEIEVVNNMLMIYGMINHSGEANNRNSHYVSRFHRSVSLPSLVSKEDMIVNYKNNQLEVRMPKLK